MIFVFEVYVREGYAAEDYADAWVRASKIIQSAAGAKGTRLHRCLGDARKLLAIASWESKDARDAMESNLPERATTIIRSQAEFVDVRPIGEFEDPEWEVQPCNAIEGN